MLFIGKFLRVVGVDEVVVEGAGRVIFPEYFFDGGEGGSHRDGGLEPEDDIGERFIGREQEQAGQDALKRGGDDHVLYDADDGIASPECVDLFAQGLGEEIGRAHV